MTITRLEGDASRVMLDDLAARVYQGHRVYHHPGEPGEVIVWDRCMLHRATEWDLNGSRVLRHVWVAGDSEQTALAS